jgi:hypothetical protein
VLGLSIAKQGKWSPDSDLCDHADNRRLMNTPAEAATAETRRMLAR